VNLPDLAYSFGFMVVVVLIGTLIFNRVEATFMDTVSRKTGGWGTEDGEREIAWARSGIGTLSNDIKVGGP